MRAPTGDQYTLRHEGHDGVVSATITQVAASLRELSIDGVELIQSYPVEMPTPGAAGIVLAPWPNRITDAAWTYRPAGGVETVQQLAVTEPKLDNAIHGLLRYTPYRLVTQSEASVTLSAAIYPQEGWPFTLDTRIAYTLGDSGLTVEHTIVNEGATSAPVAVGAHPYLKLGTAPTAELKLTVHADSHYEVDERLNVIGEHPVDGTPFDLRTAHRVGDLALDDGFGKVGPGVLASLDAPDGRRLELWGSDEIRYVQVFTHRAFPGLHDGEVALAIEPQTAPANSLNSGAGLTWLAPGESWTVGWGIRVIGF